jgi:(1->4)-alpha-D-glucan 1-alpha-D-glucosylmutase
LKTPENGRIKLFLVAKALAARNLHGTLFEKGYYQALQTTGTRRNHLVAYCRKWKRQWTVVIAPRLLVGMIDETADPLGRRIWRDTAITLPDSAPVYWRDFFTGLRLEAKGKIFAHEALKLFPVSFLFNSDSALSSG